MPSTHTTHHHSSSGHSRPTSSSSSTLPRKPSGATPSTGRSPSGAAAHRSASGATGASPARPAAAGATGLHRPSGATPASGASATQARPGAAGAAAPGITGLHRSSGTTPSSTTGPRPLGATPSAVRPPGATPSSANRSVGAPGAGMAPTLGSRSSISPAASRPMGAPGAAATPGSMGARAPGALGRPSSGGSAMKIGERPGSGYGSLGGQAASGMGGSFRGGMANGSMNGGSLYGANSMSQNRMGSLYGSAANGSMAAPGGSLYGQMGPGSAARSMNGAGSMVGGQSGMGGSMYGMGGQSGVGGSMYGMGGAPMGGSMYGMGGAPMGGPMGGSMYGPMGMGGSMYGPMGSMYGPMAGSMYGPMGSMYAPMGMGSMYGSMAGSMYGMPAGPMGSMYGLPSMYALATYQSVIDTASRRDSFFVKNDLLRADTKTLTPKKSGEEKEGEKKKREITLSDKKESEKKEGEKKEGEKKDGDKKEGEKKDGDKKESEKKEGEKGTRAVTIANGKTDSDRKATSEKKDEKPATAKASTADESKKDTAPVPSSSNTNIRALVVIEKSTKALKTVVRKDATTVTVSGDNTTVDEVIETANVGGALDSVTMKEVERNLFQGHKCGLLIGCGTGQRSNAVALMKTFLQSLPKKLESDATNKFFVTFAALKGADEGKDLLKKDASYAKLQLASSPIYGPALLGLEEREIATAADMGSLVDTAIKNSTHEHEMIVGHIVLRQSRSVNGESNLYLSSLTVALDGDGLKQCLKLKEKSSDSPARLFRYVVGGSCVTLCAACLAQEDKEGKQVITALTTMRSVKNSEPRSGNVKRFIEFTKKEIPACKEKANSATDARKASYESMLKRMEQMLKDAEELQSKPQKTAPKAYA